MILLCGISLSAACVEVGGLSEHFASHGEGKDLESCSVVFASPHAVSGAVDGDCGELQYGAISRLEAEVGRDGGNRGIGKSASRYLAQLVYFLLVGAMSLHAVLL